MIQELATALTVAKQLREIQSRIKDAEFKSLLADLQVALADAKVRVAELEEENLRLRQELAKTKQAEDIRHNLEFRDDVYYLKEPIPGRPPGPYCPGCLDSQNKLQVLRRLPKDFEAFGQFECPACKQHFGRGEFDDFPVTME
jgi:hypothetical protein